ncbi:MAG TPA: hypothetical protein VGN20_23415 [Mucilaginibacter sp.]|jgi:hypothetical protein
MYIIIEPEVAGGLGEGTIGDFKPQPPIVEKLNYEFFGWMGDDIIESFPCFIMTERLKNKICDEQLSGIAFDDVFITKSKEFFTRYTNEDLPDFFWAKINGVFGLDDFAIGNDLRLTISEKAFKILELFNLNHALLEEVKGI